MDANQILLWNNSWWGMKLTYENDEIISSPTDGKMESFTALMHSVFVRTSSWFCCLPYNNHDVNFPNAALLAYLEQKDVKLSYSTKEQRKATEIAIRALWRVCGTNPQYIAYHPRKKRINQRVVDAVEKIVLHMAQSDPTKEYRTIPPLKIENLSVDTLLNFLNEEGYSRPCKSKGLSNKN